MNAPAKHLSADTATRAQLQLDEWGVTPEEATKDLIDYASAIASTENTRIGDIVVQFGFATRRDIENHVKTKPSNIPLLEHLSEHIDNLRVHTQKLLAANDKLAYYDSLANATVHHDLQSSAPLRTFCQELHCLPLKSNADNTLRLVFGDYAAQKEYAQRSRIQRASDPISHLQQSNGITNLILAIAKREQIAIHLDSKAVDTSEATGDEDKVSVWFENSANTPNQKLLARIFTIAAGKKASNVQFIPNGNGSVDVFYRRHGNLRPIPNIRALSPLQADEINRFLHTKSLARLSSTGKHVEGRLQAPADGNMVYKTSTIETHMRCSFIPASNEGLYHNLESISIRLLPRDAVSIKLADLNISPSMITTLRNHLLQSHGLILVVGPTSSGKSTTLAGMISLYQGIYGTARHLLSLEQPIERRLQGITQISTHQSNFEANMAALLRHNPNLIWVGEMRDRPSASTCIRAANTGHIVLSTLHSDDAPTAFGALNSYISNNTGTSAESVIVTQHDAISALTLIVAQRLLPALCPHCKIAISDGARAYSARKVEYEAYCERNEYQVKNIDHTFTRNPDGCDKCDGEGYIDELPINEILPVTKKLRRAMTDMANNGKHDIDVLASTLTTTLYDEAIRLVIEGKVAINDALI